MTVSLLLAAARGIFSICCRTLADCGGGFVCVCEDRVLELLPDPGRAHERPGARNGAAGLDRLNAAARSLGCARRQQPIHAALLPLSSVIPKLRLTDKGLVDVEAFTRISLFE